jgi:hypothetical protein
LGIRFGCFTSLRGFGVLVSCTSRPLDLLHSSCLRLVITSSQLAVGQLTDRTGHGARRLTVYLEGECGRLGRRMQGVRLTAFGNRAVVGGADHGGVDHEKVNQGILESGLVSGVPACVTRQRHWDRNHAGRNIGLGQTFLIHAIRILIVHGFQRVGERIGDVESDGITLLRHNRDWALHEQGKLSGWLGNEGYISWASVEARLGPFADFFNGLLVTKGIEIRLEKVTR